MMYLAVMFRGLKKFRFVPAFLILASVLISNSLRAQEPSPINWLTLEQAVELNKTAPRKIMVDIYTQWCGPCKMLTKNTFGDARVAAYLNANFYCVKFDAESGDPVNFMGNTFTNPAYNPAAPGRNSVHELTGFLGVSAYPTIIFMDEENKLLLPVKGYQTPAQLELYLRLVAENHYQSITTNEQWAAWQSGFVPTWN